MTDVYASARVRVSPRKVGTVVALVRGRSASDAITILEHTPRRSALPIAKIIKSAVANAENNLSLDSKTLVVTEIQVGPSLTLKRFRPGAHGRAQRYKKATSNVKVTISGEAKVKKVAEKAKTATKTTTKAESEEK